MDASRHGPKKGGPIGPMGSTIGPFKYYVIHYQTLFKHFWAAGLPGQPGRPGPIKSISGRAWAGTSAHGQTRHGSLIFSCLSWSCLNGPCLDGPVPGRAGPPVWPPITGGTRSAGAALSLQPSRPQVTARLHTGSDLFFAPACVVRLLCMAGLICSLLLILSRGCACLLLSIIFIIALLVAGHPLSLLLISCCCWCPSTAIHILLVPAAVLLLP